MPKIRRNNIFSKLPGAKKREAFETLATGKGCKIERIVSLGQAKPEGKWLCSNTSEWVIVLRGRAKLLFKGARKSLDLGKGDSVFIPSKARHRVSWTHPRQKTVWLAVHMEP